MNTYEEIMAETEISFTVDGGTVEKFLARIKLEGLKREVEIINSLAGENRTFTALVSEIDGKTAVLPIGLTGTDLMCLLESKQRTIEQKQRELGDG